MIVNRYWFAQATENFYGGYRMYRLYEVAIYDDGTQKFTGVTSVEYR